jgi:hypothetical protein
LIAASNDANVRKKLYFGPSDASFRNGRSRLQVASNAGFRAVGTLANPTLVDMLAGNGTYYTFVSSGGFVVAYASFTNMDENGVWLSGSGPFSINQSTFDY